MCNIFLKPLLHPLNGHSLFHYIEQIVGGVQSNVFYPLNKQLTIQWYLSMCRTNKNNCNRLNQPKSMTSSANIMLCVSLSYISMKFIPIQDWPKYYVVFFIVVYFKKKCISIQAWTKYYVVYISKRNLFTFEFRIGLNKLDWFQNK